MRISEQTEKRVISFVNTVANDCTTCLRRCKENCDHCRSAWANDIMRDVRRDQCGENKSIDCGFVSRTARILLALKTSDHPLRSSEIDVSEYCSKSLKEYTLREMVARGMIGRKRIVGKCRYTYFLKPTHPKKGKGK